MTPREALARLARGEADMAARACAREVLSWALDVLDRAAACGNVADDHDVDPKDAGRPERWTHRAHPPAHGIRDHVTEKYAACLLCGTSGITTAGDPCPVRDESWHPTAATARHVARMTALSTLKNDHELAAALVLAGELRKRACDAEGGPDLAPLMVCLRALAEAAGRPR